MASHAASAPAPGSPSNSPESTPPPGPGAPTSRRERPVASARGLVKVYGSGSTEVRALDGVDVDIPRGEFTAVMGPSGSGKSTLMHCMAGLDSATSGTLSVADIDITRMRQSQLTKLRRTHIGFIFQAYNLVATLTARENITLPLDIAREKVDGDYFDRVIEAVGLGDRLDHRPGELSGGQQQRVACARALVTRPSVIFADEPTGNLDSRTAEDVLRLLRESVDSLGQAIVMVTHEPSAAAWADRVLFLADGRLRSELRSPTHQQILDSLAGVGGTGATGATGATEGA